MDTAQVVANLNQKVTNATLPTDVRAKLQNDLSRIDLVLRNTGFTLEVDKEISFVNFVGELPWEIMGQDILDLQRARQILDKNHHGMELVKARILEYLSILILNKRKNRVASSTILAFVGLAGAGKTTLAYSIAETLGRPIIRIPFGGLGSALQLRGESRLKPEAEPGLIIKAFHKAKVRNPVILLDELDRVTAEARADIMGVLVELLDPEQNMAFLDHYLDMPFDLSQVLFVATANNLSNVATAVLDRLEVIEMPFYSDEQKIVIGKDYLLPKALEQDGLEPGVLKIDPQLWEQIVRPLGFDGGIRSLKRNIDTLVRKIARSVVEGNPGPYEVTKENIGEYIS